MATLTPLRDEVICALVPVRGTTRHGIIIMANTGDPEASHEQEQGDVVAASADAAPELAAQCVQVGDRVAFPRYAALPIDPDPTGQGRRLVRVPVGDLMAVIT